MNGPIRVVVADDSPFLCRVLATHLQSTPGFQVVGLAHDGVRAVELAKRLRPDVITLDIEMPGLDGIDALQSIMREAPTPVIMVSGISREAAEVTLRAMQLGAVDFILKYTPGIDTDPQELRREIVSKVRAAAGVKVIRLRQAANRFAARTSDALPQTVVATFSRQSGDKMSPLRRRDTQLRKPETKDSRRDIVVIGASTGGPAAIRELLAELPADFPLPVLVVQHLPASFTGVFAAQLDRQLEVTVREAAQGDTLEPGVVLIAPGEKHMLLARDFTIELNDGPKIGGHRPAIDVTLQSAIQVCGRRTIGVLLTGMGEDGAAGLSLLRTKGGTTFAQSEESCVVFGMPRRAVELDAVQHTGSPQDIGQMLRHGYESDAERDQCNTESEAATHSLPALRWSLPNAAVPQPRGTTDFQSVAILDGLEVRRTKNAHTA